MIAQPPARGVPSVRLVLATLTLAALLALAIFGIGGSWMPEDLVRLHHFWAKDYWKLAKENVLLYWNSGEPLTGLVELTVFNLCGLHAIGFHALALAVFAADLFLLFRLAILLGCSSLHAGFAVFLMTIHAGLWRMYFRVSGLEHALALLFFSGALLHYVRIRSAGRRLSARDTAILIALYVAAFNSSPVALSLPLVLWLYEWVYGRPGWPEVRPMVWASAFALIFLAGQGVRPGMFWEWWLSGNVETTAELAYCSPNSFSFRAMCLAWAILFYIAFRRRRPELRFAFGLFPISMLPYALTPDRFLNNTHIPAYGVALVLASVVAGAVEFIGREPPFRRWPAGLAEAAATVAVAAILTFYAHGFSAGPRPDPLYGDRDIAFALGELRRLDPRIPPRSSVAFLNDPTWAHSMIRLAPLWFRDRRLRLAFPAPGSALQGADAVFEFQGGKLVQLRPAPGR